MNVLAASAGWPLPLASTRHLLMFGMAIGAEVPCRHRQIRAFGDNPGSVETMVQLLACRKGHCCKGGCTSSDHVQLCGSLLRKLKQSSTAACDYPDRKTHQSWILRALGRCRVHAAYCCPPGDKHRRNLHRRRSGGPTLTQFIVYASM